MATSTVSFRMLKNCPSSKYCIRCEQTNIVQDANGCLRCFSCGFEPEFAMTDGKLEIGYKRRGRLKSANRNDESVNESSSGNIIRFPPVKYDHIYSLDNMTLISSPIKSGNVPFSSVADIAGLYLRDADLRYKAFFDAISTVPELGINGFRQRHNSGDTSEFRGARLRLEDSDLLLRLGLVFMTFCKRNSQCAENMGEGNVEAALSIMQLLLGRIVPSGVLIAASLMCRGEIEHEGEIIAKPYLYLDFPSQCKSCSRVCFKAGENTSQPTTVCDDCSECVQLLQVR